MKIFIRKYHVVLTCDLSQVTLIERCPGQLSLSAVLDRAELDQVAQMDSDRSAVIIFSPENYTSLNVIQ